MCLNTLMHRFAISRLIDGESVFKIAACSLLILLAGCGGESRREVQSGAMAPTFKATVVTSTARPADYYTVLQQLYIAYFGRPADSAGLAYFATQLAQAGAPTDIQAYSAAYDSNATVRSMTDAFGNSTESKELYTGDTSSFVTAIYNNVLNRSPDAEGLKFWVNVINSGALTKGNASLSVMASALADTTADGTLVRNKILAGSAFTAALTTQEKIDAYKGQSAAAAARSMLSGVSAGADASTLQVTVNDTISRLVALSSSGAVVFHGTVALGSPIKDAVVSVFDRNGLLDQTLTDLNGSYMLPTKLVSALTPPYIIKAEFTVAGRKISLFSISTDDTGGDLKVNVTPITDMITRAYVPAPHVPDPFAALYNEPSRLDSITNNLRKVLGPLLPATADDPVSGTLAADPNVDDWDAMLERVKIESSAGQSTIKNANGQTMATVAASALASGTAGATDADMITAAEASAAISARGDFLPAVERHVNEATVGVLPAPQNFRAAKTGTLSFKLSWSRVDQAAQYYIYEQKETEPTISAGRYPIGATVPTYATGGNAEADVELDYTVAGSGTYYWVIGAVAADGSVTEYTLGSTSEPASLTFDENKPVTCVTETLLVDGSNASLSYCYYMTGTAPFLSKKRHGTVTLVNRGHLVYKGSYVDGIEDGAWRYYLTGEPYTMSSEKIYVNGKLTLEWEDFVDTYKEYVWKYGSVTGSTSSSPYIATSRNYCGTSATVLENRRGVLYSVLTKTAPLSMGTLAVTLTCGVLSGDACCTRP